MKGTKEAFALRNAHARGRGRVCVQYTDPLTGRVLEEIRGENHVFTPQFTATTGFQSTAMQSDLLLTQGGSQPDMEEEFPFIPGTPIGYGRPEYAGSGVYRGAYRTADSYLAQTGRSGVKSRFVYDFLPTQALGRVDWIGLTAALGNGSSIAAYTLPYGEFSTNNRVYDCKRGVYYRAATMTTDSNIHIKFARMDCFSDTAEESVDVTELAGLTEFRSGSSYPRTARIFLEQGGEAVYILYRGTPLGTTKAVYGAIKLSTDGGSVLGKWTISTGTDLIYAVTVPGGAADDCLYWMVPAEGYRGYTRYTCDLSAGSITALEIALDDADPNLVRWESSIAYVYGDCFWYPRRDGVSPADDGYSEYFLYGSPLFNMSRQAVHGWMPPSAMDKTPAQFHVGLSPTGVYSGQWLRHSGSSTQAAMPFAYTCYAMPDDTPQRPNGSAMTVTYELDIDW